jgi:acetyl/propionyl-CoA carboxylase alpha subunit/acetyl-CoA carboxylase carboxyltransferase component
MTGRMLIANRGEIAIRIARTAREMKIATVAIYSSDDANSLHVKAADAAFELAGRAAYLDSTRIIEAAQSSGCDAIHPGYGFLSENAVFARQCLDAGLMFIGPAPDTLTLFGNKCKARTLASTLGIPVLPGSHAAVTMEEAEHFLAELGEGASVMLKALAGGGGRGIRLVRRLEDIEEAFERCRSEALAAFGSDDIYVEKVLPHARHIEVQIAGDGDDVIHLWDRDCSVQRRRQKLIEIAPASALPRGLREALWQAAVNLGRAAHYRGIGTVEFLVDQSAATQELNRYRYAFLEVNPRLQVEHTVTEAITGIDLVQLQIQLADGASLTAVGLRQAEVPGARGVAIQSRINLETMAADGTVIPSAGTVRVYEPASGPGVRVDGFGYSGYRSGTRYDSLLAKLIVHVTADDLGTCAHKADRALSEFRIEGVRTNIAFLRAVLRHPAFEQGQIDTTFIDANITALDTAAEDLAPRPVPDLSSEATTGTGSQVVSESIGLQPVGTVPVAAPIHGTIISIGVTSDQTVRVGDPMLVIESMKMEHVIAAPVSGRVQALTVSEGNAVTAGAMVAYIDPSDELASSHSAADQPIDLDRVRPDLAAVLDRSRGTLDSARPQAVARRRASGQRTARENIDDLLDPGSFVEYGSFVVAARRSRRSLKELIEQTPADGLVMGLGTINRKFFAEDVARCAVMAYDYTVLAGTQGAYNHRKMDRLIEIAKRLRLPTVFFCEGGGGRPGDTEGGGSFVRGFEYWAMLSAVAPMIGIASGRCFAGNASVLGCCDIIIATRGSNIGMGGPAMIEGGGLGVYQPEEIGPVEVQEANGVIDLLAEDEADAVRIAKQYLSYFQGPLTDWCCADQRLLRAVIPENRLRVYDIRGLIETLADSGSVLELRPKFGTTMIAALIRIEGRPMGLIANNPKVLGGAIDSDGSDKAAHLLQICEAFDIPVLSLSDTPGIMVGPQIEKTALVRHCSRLFVIGANLTVPIFSVILRKSYGLGALAMTGGSYPASVFAVAWPTAEFGGMGLEGSVKLGYRSELAAIKDPSARQAKFNEMVAAAYERGKALSYASTYAIDEVIDPAETRRWIVAGLRSLPPRPARTEKKLRWIDTW